MVLATWSCLWGRTQAAGWLVAFPCRARPLPLLATGQVDVNLTHSWAVLTRGGLVFGAVVYLGCPAQSAWATAATAAVLGAHSPSCCT